MKKIALFNQKGGCAKTTSVVNIAGFLAKKGKKVLVVDCDPQANATQFLLMENEPVADTIVSVVDGEKDIAEVILPALIRTRGNANPKNIGIYVLPAERSMAVAELENEYVLKNLLLQVDGKYDYVIFDCPPYISEFTVNILAATDKVLVPATVDKDALEGYGELIDTINLLKSNGVNPNLDVLGVFLTIYNERELFDRYMAKECAETFGDTYIDIPIRRHTYAKQSALFGRPLCWYKPSSKVAKDYEALTDEIIERTEEA